MSARVWCAVTLASAATATAGPADLTGLDADQLARANPVATPPGIAGAVVGNPANLGAGAYGVTIAVVGSHAGTLIQHRPRPAGVDVDASIYAARPIDPAASLGALATADLPTRPTGTDLADEVLLVVADARRLHRRVVLGTTFAVPLSSSLAPQTFYADEREAPFGNAVRLALLDDDRRAAVLAGAVAVQVHPRVQVGVGAQLLVGAAPETRVYLPNLLAPAVSDTNTRLGVAPTVMPSLGVAVTARPWLTAHAALRLAAAQEVEGTTTIRLWSPGDDELAESVQAVRYAIDAQPLRIAAGVAARRGAGDVAAEAVYRRGADYRDLHGGAPGFRDTVEVGVHGGGRLGPLVAQAGARWVPSPVPPQRGRTNHADADRFVVGAGVRHGLGGGLQVALSLGAQRLVPTGVTKDPAQLVDEFPDSRDAADELIPASQGLQTNNPGYPGYDVGGWILAAAVSLHLER